MSSAKITLLGMCQYYAGEGKDIFGGMILPDGIEKDLVCNAILTRGAEFEVIYSNPDQMASLISYWSRRYFRTFRKWFEALSIEYDPLYNFDRHEEWTDTDKGTETGHGTRTNNLKDESDLKNESSVSSKIENKRSAFDTSSYQPHDLSNTETVSNSKDTGTVTHTGTQANQENRSHDKTGTHVGRMYGNIGVTTSQIMLEAELSIDAWNLYDHISDLFLQEFTIPIYI